MDIPVGEWIRREGAVEAEEWRERARRAQAGAEREQGRVRHGGVDPDYIRRLEHFPGFSHAEIYAAVQAMDPGAMRGLADEWTGIADGLSGAVFAVGATTEAALAEGLAGRVADAAMAAVREFVLEAMDVVGVAHSAGHRITAAAAGAEAVRRSVPPPPEDTVGATAPHVAMLIGAAPEDAHELQARREELYREALAALEANYLTTYPPAGSGVPAFGPVYAPGAGGGGAGAGSAAGAGGGNAAGGGSGNQLFGGDESLDRVKASRVAPNPAMPGERALPGTDSTIDGAEFVSGSPVEDEFDSVAAISGAETTSNEAAGQSADGQTRAAFVSGTDGSPERAERSNPGRDPVPGSPATPGLPTAPGSPTSPGSLHRPSLPVPGTTPVSPGTGSPPSGGPGRGFPAPPNSGLPSPALSSSPAARSVHPGMGFLPGMYPPGARGASDTDADHKTPAWLIRNREAELLGSPPPHVPPVLGSEIPSARTGLADDPDTRS